MLLVNGADVIGTGWMTKIPNFNPRNFVSNLKRCWTLKSQSLCFPCSKVNICYPFLNYFIFFKTIILFFLAAKVEKAGGKKDGLKQTKLTFGACKKVAEHDSGSEMDEFYLELENAAFLSIQF